MHPFILERPRDLDAALALRVQAGRNDAPVEYIAGGTDMVQLLQEYVRRPERLVSLAGLLNDRIEAGPQGLRIGAAATMADVAAHPAVVELFPVIAESLLESASPQVRNQATMAGNLMQRPRCPYFRDVGYEACNRRAPGSGCSAMAGVNRWHVPESLRALGGEGRCAAAHGRIEARSGERFLHPKRATASCPRHQARHAPSGYARRPCRARPRRTRAQTRTTLRPAFRVRRRMWLNDLLEGEDARKTPHVFAADEVDAEPQRSAEKARGSGG